MKFGVFGSAAGEMKDTAKAGARAIGRRIAQTGNVVVTGGCRGLPYEAVLGANELHGKCIAFSPAVDLGDHIEVYNFPTTGFSEYVFVPRDYANVKNTDACKKYRNVNSVAYVDAAIIIGGRIGTMNEFTIAYDLGKKIGILGGSGGITSEAIRILLRDAAKESKAKIRWNDCPEPLVDSLIEL